MIARSLRLALQLTLVLAVISGARANAESLLTPATVVNPSPRSIGMGQTGGADDRDPLNSFFNPAILGTQTGMTATLFTGEFSETFIGDLDLRGVDIAGGHAFHSGSSTIGVGGQIRFANLEWGEVHITNLQGQSLGTFKQNDGYSSFSLAGSIQLESGLAAGVGGTFRSYRAEYGVGDDTDATGWDAGLIASYTFGTEQEPNVLSAGLSFLNASSDVNGPLAGHSLIKATKAALSARTVGSPVEVLGTEVPSLELVFNIDVTVPDGDIANSYGVGVEAAIFRVGFVRVGWVRNEARDGSSVVGGAGVGLPFDWALFRLDYAATPITNLGTDEDIENRDHKAALVVSVPLQRLAAK